VSHQQASKLASVVDLDVDIGADAVDYKCVFLIFLPFNVQCLWDESAIANQESLSGLETEMRKLEGIVKEILDEMKYLEKREERFTSTNSTLSVQFYPEVDNFYQPLRMYEYRILHCSRSSRWLRWAYGRFSICARTFNASTLLISTLYFLVALIVETSNYVIMR